MNLNLNLDPGDLTLGEIRDIEIKTGKTISQVIEDLRLSEFNMDEAISVLWVLHRRDNAEFTFEDAADLKLSDITIITEEDEPTSA